MVYNVKLTLNLLTVTTSPVAEGLFWMPALFQVVIEYKVRNTHMEMEESWCDFEDLSYK